MFKVRLLFVLIGLGMSFNSNSQINLMDISDDMIRNRLLSYEDIPFHWDMKGNIQVSLNVGINALKEGKIGIALHNLSEAIRLDSTLWMAYYYRGICNKLTFKMNEARLDFRRVIRLKPYALNAVIELGKTSLLSQQSKEAEVQFIKASKLAPDKVVNFYFLGIISLQKQDFDKARFYFKQCGEIDEKFPDAEINLGLLEMVQGKDINMGLIHFNKVLVYDSLNAYALVLRCLINMKKDPVKSLSDLDKLVQTNVNNALYIVMRGNLLIELKEFDKAFLDFRRLVEASQLNENYFAGKQTSKDKMVDLQYAGYYLISQVYGFSERDASLLKKAYCLLITSRFEDCLLSIDETSIANKSAVCLFLKGLANEHMGRHLEAEALYDRALSFDNDILDAHKKRGIYRTNKLDWRGGAKDFSDMLRINPQAVMAYQLRGVARFNQKDYRGALEDFNKYIENDSTNKEAIFNRGGCYANLGEYLLAADDFLKCGNGFNYLDPVRIEQSFDQLLIKGDTSLALTYLNRFLRMNSNFAEGYAIKIKILRNQHKWDMISQIIDHALNAAHDRYAYHDCYSYLLAIKGMLLAKLGESDRPGSHSL